MGHPVGLLSSNMESWYNVHHLTNGVGRGVLSQLFSVTQYRLGSWLHVHSWYKYMYQVFIHTFLCHSVQLMQSYSLFCCNLISQLVNLTATVSYNILLYLIASIWLYKGDVCEARLVMVHKVQISIVCLKLCASGGPMKNLEVLPLTTGPGWCPESVLHPWPPVPRYNNYETSVRNERDWIKVLRNQWSVISNMNELF